MKRYFVLPLLLLFLLPAFAALAADQDLIALFMEIDADTTYAEALQMFKDTRLPYSEMAYSVGFADDKELSICVANTSEAAVSFVPVRAPASK